MVITTAHPTKSKLKFCVDLIHARGVAGARGVLLACWRCS